MTVVALTIDDLYTLLYEECAEVIKAGAKCERFGPDRNWPGYGVNKEVLAQEFGDLYAVMGALELALRLNPDIIKASSLTKIARAERAKREAVTGK